MKPVAALFVTRDSHYKALGVECFDIDRDARTFQGGASVVAHPPCRAWASLRHHAKPRPDEKDLAHFAIAAVRKNGGVLEHPWLSTLWAEAGLPQPQSRDAFGGFTLPVSQHWWGHRAKKMTRLYIVGVEPAALPPVPLLLGEATHTVGLWSGRNRETCRPSIAKREYEQSPPAFAAWLVEVARLCA